MIEGDGFLYTAGRGIVTALQVVSRAGYPIKVVASMREGAEWCAQYVDKPPTWPDDLMTAVEFVRSRQE